MKRKSLLSFLLCLTLLLGLASTSWAASGPARSAASVTATPTASKVLVNGKPVSFDAYNINGSNYFKLRDIAYTLNGTQKQFDVAWDSKTNAITLTPGKAYTAVGSEMASRQSAGAQTATPTASKIYIQSTQVSFDAYNIGGANYFKLRDIGEAFDFGVDWDSSTQTISISTEKGYEAPATPPSDPSTDEYQRAIRYGFVPDSLLIGDAREKKITYGAFMTMLDNAVKRINADKLTEWKARFPEARQSQDVIDTGNAALALFAAAETIGGEVYARNANDKGDGSFSNDWTPAGFWGDVERTPVGFEAVYGDTADGSFIGWCGHYVTSRGSVLTGNTLFSYQDGKTQLENRDLTYEDAALACLRLYESSIVITERTPTAEDAALLARVEEKKREILTSKTDVSYTGTAYYVSNSGGDSSDGKSPSTAWATIQKVVNAGTDGTLKPGDAVFFERGGLWRGEVLYCAEGVTYSAYGAGDKPKIYGSEEDYSGTEKWTLWYDQGGVKIWKLYRDVTQVGNIVFDGGESYATRVYSYYNGKEWVVSSEDQRPFDVVEGLKQDLTFYSTFDLSKEQYEAYVSQFGEPLSADQIGDAGALYLRCDSGNPGELYQEIEFHQALKEMGYMGLVTPAGNNTIDNLCIKYCIVNGIAIYGSDRANSDNNGNVIQNCEIAWTGGSQHELNRAEGDVMVCGEAIVWKTDNNKFLHNYVYQACCAGFVSEFVENEWVPGVTCSGTVISGNVVEKCQDTFWFWDNGGSVLYPGIVFWDNTSITDNYVMNMGYGWSGDPRFLFPENPTNTYHKYGESFAFHIGGAASGIRNMRVSNNVFYLTAGGNLISHSVFEDWDGLTFHGNTYVQNDNRSILRGEIFRDSLTVEDTLEDIRTWLGDDAAVVFQPSAKLE